MLFPTLSIGQRVQYLFVPLFFLTLAIIICGLKFKLSSTVKFISVLQLIPVIGLIFKVPYVEIEIVLEHARGVLNAIVLVSAYSITRKLEIKEKGLNKIIFSIFLMNIIFMFLQLFELRFITDLFTTRAIISIFGLQVAGVFIWTYSFAIFLVPMLAYFLHNSINNPIRLKDIFMLSLVVLLLLFTQSKAAYLTSALLLLSSIIFPFFLNIYIKRNSLITIFIFAALMGILVFGIYQNISYFGNIERFFISIEAGNLDASTQTRIDQLKNIRHDSVVTLLFGSIKDFRIVENAYGAYIIAFGYVGFVCYITILLVYFATALRQHKFAQRNNFEHHTISARYAFIWLTVSLFIFSLGSTPLDGHKIGYLIWIMLGMYDAAARNSKKQFITESK